MDEALAMLSEYGEEATVLAGGTDVMPQVNLGLAKPKVFLFIGRLGLEYVHSSRQELIVGSATRIKTLMESPLVRKRAAVLAEGAASLGSPLTKSLATIGGNICNASPAADTATPLIALGAEVVLVSKRGERVVPITKFFTGPGTTVRKPNELLKEFRIPVAKRSTKFIKLERRHALSLSIVNVAVSARNGGPKLQDVRIALGAVAPTPVRAAHAEKLLLGEPLSDALIEEAANAAVQDIKPISDVHGSKWYRTKVTPVLVARALHAAVEEAK
jgi:CO/xanthine dehydrogenase FAD-binding subunit